MPIQAGQPILASEVLAVSLRFGMSIPWFLPIAQIPSGFIMCDGNSGTPNMFDKFIKGVPNGSTNPGGTGGSVSKEMAGHKHNIATPTYSDLEHGAFLVVIDIPAETDYEFDFITDIRPPYYEMVYITKT